MKLIYKQIQWDGDGRYILTHEKKYAKIEEVIYFTIMMNIIRLKSAILESLKNL
jgi:hypothetical protein